jgi:hypothetical protein
MKCRRLACLIVLVAGGITAAARAEEIIDLEGAIITGNRELPKALHIVPWKPAAAGDLAMRPLNSLVDELPAPVDREVFYRELEYYEAVHSIDHQDR